MAYNSSYTGAQVDTAVGKLVNNGATAKQVLSADGSGSENWIDNCAVKIEAKNAAGTSLGDFSVVKCTAAEYAAITTKSSTTIYIIVG